MTRVLVVDDEGNIRLVLKTLLRKHGYEPSVAASAEEALEIVDEVEPDFIIADVRMPGMTGIEMVAELTRRKSAAVTIVMSAYGSVELALEAMKAGAYDYISKPFKQDEVLLALRKAEERESLKQENAMLRKRVREQASFGTMIGSSPAMQDVFRTIEKVAGYTTTVLVQGESGTGKELVARALHEQSDRREAGFVVVNCGALPENLMESELFGHERGSFTGASAAKEGLVRAAEGGTLFLDEIGELPLPLQVKLLRVLQERKVRPIGSETETPVDVRVVAATNRDLEAEIEAGSFREDLYYRLNVIRLALPPLRERPEDIRPLAEHLLEKHAALQRRTLSLSEQALRWLSHRSFPGNVRELENVIERGVALGRGPVLTVEDLGGAPSRPPSMFPPDAGLDLTKGIDLDAHLATIETRLLREALRVADGNRTKAAELVGMTFRSFRYRLAKLTQEDGD